MVIGLFQPVEGGGRSPFSNASPEASPLFYIQGQIEVISFGKDVGLFAKGCLS